MDTITLVDDLLDEGQRLVDKLAEQDVPLSVAFWVKLADEERWSLYLASPLVDEKGRTAVYRDVYRVLRSMGDMRLTDSDIKAIGANDPMAKDAAGIKRRFREGTLVRVGQSRIGKTIAEQVYIYPGQRERPLRQVFNVQYVREGLANRWVATTKRGGTLKGPAMTGALGYSTAHWESEDPGSVKQAMVMVLLEIDIKFDHLDLAAEPALLRALTDQANLLADEMFRQHHPDAEIVRYNVSLETDRFK